MIDRFIAFDLEMPSNEPRISAIGITVVENGEVADRIYYLVNPETDFEPDIIDLIGITPEMVENEPAFPAIWEKVKDVMSSGLLVAHGASGDMKVLCSCLKHYGIKWLDNVPYLCTLRMGLKCYPELKRHSLDAMCKHIHFKLNHHHAQSDSEGCAMLLLDYLKNGNDYEKYVQNYNPAACCNVISLTENKYIQCNGKGFERKVRIALLEMQDEKKREETIGKLPYINEEKIIGVEELQLRVLANTLIKRNQKDAFVKLLPHEFHEENNLHALLISKSSKFSACISLLDKFLPYVDNKETCELLLPKIFKRRQPELNRKIDSWLQSDNVYTREFAVMVKNTYFSEDRES